MQTLYCQKGNTVVISSTTLRRADMRCDPRTVATCAIVLVFCFPGCGKFTPISIDVSYLEKDSSGNVTVGKQSGNMTLKKKTATGTSVAVGPQNKTVKVMVAEIRDGKLVLDVSHPDYAAQKEGITVGETKDILLGDNAVGVRVKVGEAQ